jgi:hypothetical protein
MAVRTADGFEKTLFVLIEKIHKNACQTTCNMLRFSQQ